MKTIPVLICAAAAWLTPATAQAAYIKLVDEGGVAGTGAEAAFNVAAAYWCSILSNDVTITIAVEYRPLEAGLLGGSSNNYMSYATADWVAGVEATQSASQLDASVVLPTLTDDGASFVATGTTADGRSDSSVLRSVTGDSVSSQTLYLQTAVVKAIGGTPRYRWSNVNQADAFIVFSSDVAMDFDPSDGITEGSYDFVSIALHEIGHALGFSSGVDWVDGGSDPDGDGSDGDVNDFSTYSALDMFRYSDDPADVVGGDAAVIDLSVGASTYFSIDGGETALFGNGFASGTHNGDGEEASHWRDTPGCDEVGIMSPRACKGDLSAVTASDLAAFDAIGWNLTIDVLDEPGYAMTSADIYRAFASPVPEASAWTMMLAGFTLMGWVLRCGRRRRFAHAVALAGEEG